MNNAVVVIGLLCLLLLLSACPKVKNQKLEDSNTQPKYKFRHDGTLDILNAEQKKASFDIEIVVSNEERARGLMYREEMQANQGMLFIFETSDFQSFWMKNTYLSLDMIFINEDMKIVHIAKNTKPFSEEYVMPEQLSQYVLEVNAGMSDQLNITIGDTVKWQRK